MAGNEMLLFDVIPALARLASPVARLFTQTVAMLRFSLQSRPHEPARRTRIRHFGTTSGLRPCMHNDFELWRRRAGVLLHPTSLPSGKLDGDVERWLQWLATQGFSLWQVLPLGEPQGGLSPYQSNSTFAINPALIDALPPLVETDADFQAFIQGQAFWLDDYALFKLFKQRFDDAPWHAWPPPYRSRNSEASRQAEHAHRQELNHIKWQQYRLYRRWQAIRRFAAERDIVLFGDLPIFVAYDSADVWAHPEWFLLDENRRMTAVSGVPPDYFSETGQRWGNPHYHWQNMQADDFTWWRNRIRHHLDLFDIIRIDHFRGLEAVWMIDADCETAVEGHWQTVPGDALLSRLQQDNDPLPFVAEDLGIITDEVNALRKKFHLPGMAVLQFGFDGSHDNPHRPENITEDKIVYTGTHDNDTTVGWYTSLDANTRTQVLDCLALKVAETNTAQQASQVVGKMQEQAMASPAVICVMPLQDLLKLDSRARMNVPGTIDGNWQWQFQWSSLETLDHEESRRQIARCHRARRAG